MLVGSEISEQLQRVSPSNHVQLRLFSESWKDHSELFSSAVVAV